MRVLESQRILLKPVEREDLDYLAQLRWDKEVCQFINHEPISCSDQERWFNNIQPNDMPLSIFIKEDSGQRIAGTTGLYAINHRHQRANWRIRITNEVQGHGYGYEATLLLFHYGFTELNLNRITSNSRMDNSKIRALVERLGSIHEGTLKEHEFSGGKFNDVGCFAALRNTFLQHNHDKLRELGLDVP